MRAVLIGIILGVFGILSTILFAKAVQWSEAVSEEINKVSQDLFAIKEQLEDVSVQLKVIADVLNGTVHERNVTEELMAIEEKVSEELGKKIKEE
jgi:hypothetical protein